MTIKERFVRELKQHGNMSIDWLADNVCVFVDTNDRTDRGIAIINGEMVTFINDKFEKNAMTIAEYEHAEDDPATLVVVSDIDLCIGEDGCMTFDELHDLCIENCVAVELESEVGPSGWPTYTFKGIDANVKVVFKKLGLEDVDELVEQSFNEPENVNALLRYLASFFSDSEVDEKHNVLYVANRLFAWFDIVDACYYASATLDAYDRHEIVGFAIDFSRRMCHES